MSHIRYADPRIYSLFAHYNWVDIQRDLLEGRRSWLGLQAKDAERRSWMVDCLRERGVTFQMLDGTMHIGTSVPLPEPDPFLPLLIEQWRLRDLPAQILSLEHVETCEGGPICKGTVYGSTGGKVGSERSRYGLQADVYIVGRLDVRHLYATVRTAYLDDAGETCWRDLVQAGEHVIPGRRHMRRTLARARNTARRIAAFIPAWDAYLVRQAIEDCEPPQVDLMMAEQEDDLVGALG